MAPIHGKNFKEGERRIDNGRTQLYFLIDRHQLDIIDPAPSIYTFVNKQTLRFAAPLTFNLMSNDVA